VNHAPAIAFDNSYAQLPARLFLRQLPTPVAAPRLIRINHALAHHLRIDPVWLQSDAGLQVLAGNQIPEVPVPSPRCMRASVWWLEPAAGGWSRGVAG